MGDNPTPTIRPHLSLLAACLSCAFALLAAWIIPLRLASSEGGYFSVAYLADENTYIQRLDVLPEGATASNIYNGVGDNNVIAPFYQDRICRVFLQLTG